MQLRHLNKLVPLLLLLSIGCREPSEPASSSTDVSTGEKRSESPVERSSEEVLVTSEFLQDMGHRLLKGKLSVRKIVPAEVVSPDWRPRRTEIERLRAAKSIVMSGSGFEPWKDRVSLPVSRVVDSSSGYKEQLIRIPDAVTHQHGPDGAHSHAGAVWATWLDPELAAAQLTELEKVLANAAPDQKMDIARAAGPIKAQLKSLGDELDAMKLKLATARMVFVSDAPPVMYLTRRLGLELKYLHWQNPSAPSNEDEAELQALVVQLKEAPSQRIFLLNDRCPKSAEDLCRASGFEVLRIDILEMSPSPTALNEMGSPSDTISRMKQNIEQLKAAISALN